MRRWFIALMAVSMILPGIASANRGKIRIIEHLSTEKAPSDKMQSEVADKWIRHNQMIDLVEAGYLSRIQDLAYRIGNNQNLEVDQDAANTMENFILSASFNCIPDELPDGVENEDSPGIKASYYFVFHFELTDPQTNEIVSMYKVDAKFTSANRLSAQEQAELALKLLDDPGIPNIDQIEADITANTDYHSARIRYAGTSAANGKNTGKVTVSGIRNNVIGEAKNNPISGFELRCEKGKFKKTNTRFVRFEGNEYFHGGPNSISFDYETYNCADFENDKTEERFTLVQISRFAGNIEEKLVQEEVIEFNCGSYNITAHYSAPGFADAKVVWKNVSVLIPDDLSKIPVYHAEDFENDDVPEVIVPYAINIPDYGMEYYLSECMDELEIPEIISLRAGRPGAVLWIEKGEEALNKCSVEKTPENPFVHLVLQFDLYIGENEGDGEQIAVGTDSEFPDAYTFPWKSIDPDILEKLQAGQFAEKKLSNQAGATLTITFDPK
ncbi:hypothetical protein [Lentimicrobium sp.]|uniref:hypothetical protein n=1 Tax=Lentimicrobium sp. TaxID=2034841 RepID=UPI002CC0CEB2|nr:hypothetical protein [Lentimicrobium sp.]HPR27397.1 hypothetical protein [Lentimicrobium sp.]